MCFARSGPTRHTIRACAGRRRARGGSAWAGEPASTAPPARPARPRLHAARRRSGSRCRSACGCSASPARPSRASGAACARRRRPSGRRGPSRSPTRAGRSPRAGSTWPSASASSWISSNSRRVRSTLTRRRRRPGTGRRGSRARRPRPGRPRPARLGAPAPPHDGLDARDQLLRVAGLGDPVVGAEPQPADALGDRGVAGADDHAERRAAARRPSRGSPSPRAEHREVDDERVEAHRDERVDRHGAGEHAVLPAGGVEPVGEHLQEAGVGVEHRRGARAAGRSWSPSLAGG